MLMKEKIIIISIVLLGVIFIIFCVSNNPPVAKNVQENSNIGRFQLFQGTFESIDPKNKRVEKEIVIFLLDTTSGKVKQYSTGITKEGRFYEGWRPTDFKLSETIYPNMIPNTNLK